MDMSNFRPDQLHVALQSRRDKLRYQQNAMGQGGLEVYADNLEQLSSHHQGLDPDFMQLRSCRYGNVSYDPSSFSTNPLDKAIPHGDSSFANSSQAIASSFSFPAKVNVDPQNGDWVGNYASGSVSIAGNINQMMVREGFPGDMKIINSSHSIDNLKPSYFGFVEAQSSLLTNPSCEISSHNVLKHNENINFVSTPFYHQNTLQDVVTSATIGNQEPKMVSFAQQNLVKETGRVSWMNFSSNLENRPEEGCHQRVGGANRNFGRDMRASSSAQALSLSLSSVPASALRLSHEEERNMPEHMHSSSGSIANTPDSKLLLPKSLMVGSSNSCHRNVGPLGPFTGYATILRSSKFLRPAQQLLDEFCNVPNPKNAGSCEASGEVLRDLRVSSDAVQADESVVRAAGSGSGDSSSTFYSSNEQHHQEGGVLGSSSSELFRPEYIQRKAKLLYMQEEVCRRYKQYHQQMQMVVSSFESVAGLSAATPFISLSLKTISRHFRCLKNAIVGQLKDIGKALGEEFSCPITRSSNSKGEASTSRLKFVGQSFQKQRDVGGSVRTFEPQQHVWRPQRGLPERAVAILRTWLFDHFLHPYPTDADKHMLANQTGLTRNQVSNWFINARVRVWKPMVEEIHMLEAKGLVESGSNARRTDDDKPSSGPVRGPNDSQQLNKLGSASVRGSQINSSDIVPSASAQDRSHPDMWNLDKRSGVGSHHSERMDESLMDFMPCPRSRIEIGGLGAVSLTLGLRQSAEGVQQPEHQFMQHYGDQVMHDFVG